MEGAATPCTSSLFNARFEDMHRGGWDPDARLADQDRDGVSAEILYPTVGMLLCNHPDFRRLLWANDFPHSDSTWPNSQALLARHAAHLTDEERALVLHDNVAKLFGLA